MVSGDGRSPASVWAEFPAWGSKDVFPEGMSMLENMICSDSLMAGLNCTVVGSNIGLGVVQYEPSHSREAGQVASEPFVPET